jgi:zinc protease
VTQVNKALLVMALPTADLWDIKRTRRLNVLAEIISERLRVRVREKLGAAYSTAAFSWPSRAYRDYGMMIVYIPLASETLDMVRAEVRAILLDIGQQGVNQEELQRALEPILTGIRDRFRENPYWLKTVLAGASQHPEQLEWSRTIMADYAGIQTDDIDAIARRYIDLSKLAVIEARAVRTP